MGSMGEFEGNNATQSATCCTMCKRGSVRIGHERFENGDSVLGRHPGRGYTGSRRSPTLQTRCYRDTPLVASYGGRILTSRPQGVNGIYVLLTA